MRQALQMSRSSQQHHGMRAGPVSAIAALLLAAYVVAFAQRQLPATLAEPMTRRFDLADAEMGALIAVGRSRPRASSRTASSQHSPVPPSPVPRMEQITSGLQSPKPIYDTVFSMK